ncbi:Vanillin dehydrogenase [Burkholderiaceae bacterium]|nr:Vanillin dehydrogenase [Burkholderiaceae bacterium]
MATYKVGYFVGSLASTSINRLLAKALVRLAPAELELTGMKDSGYGRFDGRAVIDEFSELKWITIEPSVQQYPV